MISAGPVPDVAGKSLSDAIAALAAVKLTGQEGDHANSDTVPKGDVIGLQVPDGAVLKPNDTVKLQVSDGPAAVAVPAIVGMTWDKAKAALDAAGLKYNYDHAADTIPGLVTVRSTNPKAGVMVHRGDTITVRFTG